MNPHIKKRLMRTAILSLVGLTIGAGAAFWQIRSENAQILQQGQHVAHNIEPMAGLNIGGTYSLINHNGEAITEASYNGQYKLVFFGFTSCPAICPTELTKMSKAMKTLPADKVGKVQPIFITVDPERDTAQVMKDYVALYDPRLIGLTGNAEQIQEMQKNYRVFAAKAQDPALSDYTMNHSSFIYLMSPDNELLALYGTSDNADFIAQDIQKRL